MPARRKKTHPRSTPPPEAPPETLINLQGSDNAVATGKSIAANIRIIFQGGWKPFAVVLLAVAALLSAILYYVIPRQEAAMTRQFNVAVAEFLVQDSGGKIVSGTDGITLARYIGQEIDTQFAAMELGKSISYQVWGPDQTGRIEGDTPEERSRVAQRLAEKINAYILVYGTVVQDGERSRFNPEFYINHKSFLDASEITGSHRLGRQLAISLPFQGIQSAQNPALAGRIRALNLITMGLAFYSVDQFERALPFFQQAEEEQSWVGAGREVVYLLIGNTHVRSDSQTKDLSSLPEAMRNYELALEHNPQYGRALIGMANVLYLQASEDRTNCDPAGLTEASDLLTEASALPDQPPSANIEAKTHFYRGQIAMLREACGDTGQDWGYQAQQEFSWVVDEYEHRAQGEESDAEGLQSLAAHAYAGLGYLTYQRGDPDTAIQWLEKAVEIASPYYQGVFQSLIGDIFAATGRKEEALQSYNEAIAIAEMKADAVSMARYEAKLRAIQGQP